MSTEPVEEENESLDFSMFGLFFDEEEAEKEKLKRKSGKATQKAIKELSEFIGGFEAWCRLNEDCQKEVVKYLDYISRCRLARCSKSDYRLVDKTPMFIYSIEIKDNESFYSFFRGEDTKNVAVQVQFDRDFNSGKRFELVFSQLGDDTLIQWAKNRKQRDDPKLIIESSYYFEEAVKFAEKWMKKCNYGMKRINVEMEKYPIEKSQIKSLPQCKNVRIKAGDVETFRWWMHKVPEELVDLQLLTQFENRETFTIPSDFLADQRVMNVEKFYFWCRADFSDDQFLNLKATKLSFDCVNLTDQAINQFLKKWINGKAVDGFKEALLWGDKHRDEAELIRGISVRPWDDEFEREAAGFCGDFERVCGRGTCYQIYSLIDPELSVTLSIHSDRISIYATGRKYEYGGKVYTGYSIP